MTKSYQHMQKRLKVVSKHCEISQVAEWELTFGVEIDW